ncbi:hypothetical protein [Euzebya sp.]|uniref:hypothetical protein n=1 Tax=Euzebya sp. TaxID=1971409 RepID=UPI003515DAB8
MRAAAADLEEHLQAEDGVVEVAKVLAHLDFPWAVLPAGPRRWAPSDLSVEVDGDRLSAVRMTYRTVGDRVVVVAGCRAGVDVDDLAERLSTPLMWTHLRRLRRELPPAAILAALRGEPEWESGIGAGWRFGVAGVGERPVRLAHRRHDAGDVLVAVHGVAREEVDTLVASLEAVEPGSELTEDLGVRHRRALAQRWWDAPRAPWTPDED